MSWSAADTDALLADDLPGYTLASIAGIGSVPALFSDRWRSSLGMGASSPTLKVATADVATLEEGAAVTLDIGSYTVAEIRPEGAGFTLLVLTES